MLYCTWVFSWIQNLKKIIFWFSPLRFAHTMQESVFSILENRSQEHQHSQVSVNIWQKWFCSSINKWILFLLWYSSPLVCIDISFLTWCCKIPDIPMLILTWGFTTYSDITQTFKWNQLSTPQATDVLYLGGMLGAGKSVRKISLLPSSCKS